MQWRLPFTASHTFEKMVEKTGIFQICIWTTRAISAPFCSFFAQIYIVVSLLMFSIFGGFQKFEKPTINL